MLRNAFAKTWICLMFRDPQKMNNNPSRFSKWCIKQWEHKRSYSANLSRTWTLKCQTFEWFTAPSIIQWLCLKREYPKTSLVYCLVVSTHPAQKCFIYCGWKKSCTTWDGRKPVNNGINHLWCRISSIHRMTRLNQSSQV